MSKSFAPMLLLVLAGFCACAGSGTSSSSRAPVSSAQHATSSETPLPAETSPPGDIPDTQAFVTYRSRDGRITVAYPEGWEQTGRGRDVKFIHDFDGEGIRAGAGTGAALAVRDIRTTRVHLGGGPAVLLVYTSNSLPNAVTGKRVRLFNNTYVLQTARGPVALDLWAPQGADNVDQWKHIASTFKAH